jgi:hypothetical protein
LEKIFSVHENNLQVNRMEGLIKEDEFAENKVVINTRE